MTNATAPLIYNLSWYLDIVCDQWKGIVLSEGEKYVAVLPIPTHQKFGRDIVRNPIFIQQLGISFLKGHENKLNAIIDLLTAHFTYINPLHLNYSNLSIINESHPKVSWSTNCNKILSLNKSYMDLVKGFSKSKRKEVRQAKAVEQKIIKSSDPSELFKMFDETAAPKIKGGIHPKTYKIADRIIEKCLTRGMGQLYYTEHEDSTLGSGLFITNWQGKITALMGASYEHSRQHNGRTLIFDHIIESYAETNTVLDFESSNDAPDVSEYYRRFGATDEGFPVMVFEELPWHIKALRRLKKKVVETISN